MSELTYTTIRAELCQPTAELIALCFPDMPSSDQYTEEDLLEMVELFPEGTIIVLDEDRVVGMGTGLFIDVDPEGLPNREHHLLYDQSGESKHSLDGDYYYGSDLAVHPEYRGQGIARQLYGRRKAIVTDYGKKGFYAAAVIPGYAAFKEELDIHAYVDKVIAGDLFDPTLSVQLRNGFSVVKLLHDFYVFPQSGNWSALIYWQNPEFD